MPSFGANLRSLCFLSYSQSELLRRLDHTHSEADAASNLPLLGTLCDSRPASPTTSEAHPDALKRLQAFAGSFRTRRIELGFSQADVQGAVEKMYGAPLSQSTVSRFEALNLSYSNMRKLRPVLERWLHEVTRAAEVEEAGGVTQPAGARCVELKAAGRHGTLTVPISGNGEPRLKRRRRTQLSPSIVDKLAVIYQVVSWPCFTSERRDSNRDPLTF